MTRCAVAMMFALVPLLGLLAEPVNSALAGKAAGTWLRERGKFRCPIGNQVEKVRYCSTSGGAEFHVVSVKGGGVVITSADTDIEPIVAFSSDSEFVEGTQNPLWVMLDKDLSRRSRRKKTSLKSAATGGGTSTVSSSAERWARLTGGESRAEGLMRKKLYAASPNGVVSDVRVDTLLSTSWSQDDGAFNYYTPKRYPCGCVATAGGQVMRYHRYPTDFVSPKSFKCRYESGRDWVTSSSYYVVYTNVTLTMQGGIYDWDSMPDSVGYDTTDSQKRAAGKLTSDLGIACRMDYADSGSGCGLYMLAPALTEVFGYANAVPIERDNMTLAEFKRGLIPNLDAKLPVPVSVSGADGGHAVVADGYGFSSGVFYVHFNLGWGGPRDAWYAPPEFDEFHAIDGILINIYPTGDAGSVICSGRVVSSVTGLPVAGAKVSVPESGSYVRGSCISDENGIYALIVPPGTYEVTAENEFGSTTKSATIEDCVGVEVYGEYYSPGCSIGNLHDCDLQLETAPAYTIGFDPNGGTCATEVIACEVGAAYGELPTAYRTGYTFSGWWTAAEGGSQVTAETTASSSTTVYAHWTANACEIRFDAGSGKCAVEKISATFGSPLGDLPGATCDGQVFLGWYKWYYNGTMVTSDSVVDGDATYYARWGTNEVSHVVDKSLEGGFVDAPGIGDAIDAPGFNWWTTELYPWTAIFDASVLGVSAARSREMSYATTSSLRTWVTGPATLSFSYQIRTYYGDFSVTCDDDTLFFRHDDVCNMEWDTVSASIPAGNHSICFAYAHPSEGYMHGWGNGVRLDAVSITGGQSYTPPKYAIVVLDSDGGDVSLSRDVIVGQALGTLPLPNRSGYEFLGWFDDNGHEVSSETTITECCAFHAHWRELAPPAPVVDPDPVAVPVVDRDPVVVPVAGPESVVVPVAGPESVVVPVADPESVVVPVADPEPVVAPGSLSDPDPPPTSRSVSQTLLFQSVDQTPFRGGEVYNGWVRKGDAIAGLLTIKSAKPKLDRYTGAGFSKLTVTYTPVGGKKISIKGVVADTDAGLPVSVYIPELGTVRIGGEQVFAADGTFQVGVDNSKSKDPVEKEAAVSAFAGFGGVKAFALESSLGYAAFSVTVDKKGKGKLVGNLPDGSRVSVSSQGVLGNDGNGCQLAIPFVFSKKASFGMVLWVHSDRTVEVSDLTPVMLANGAKMEVDGVVAGTAGNLADGQDHRFECGFFTQVFSVAGGKWMFQKNQPRLGAANPNPNALKLSCKGKDGSVKGSFAVSLPGAAKPVKFTVAGMVIRTSEGVKMYGSATAKRPPASASVSAQ